MSIFDRIAAVFTGGKAEVRPEIGNATYSDAVMEAFGANPNAAGQAVNSITAMRVAAVFACVEKIAGAIGTLPLHIYRFEGETPVRQPRDDLWFKLNERPSEHITASANWENVNAQRLLRGDSFMWLRYGLNGAVREILPLPWECVTPQITAGVVRYYVNVPEYGISTYLDPYEVLHFKSLGFDYRTMRSPSTIQYGARAAVGNALAMDAYSGKFFENGAHPSIVLNAPNKMTQEQIDKLQKAFANKYAGADNFHRLPLVLTEGLTHKEISLSADDAQLLEARKFQVIDIARAFGVPPHMIGETSASTSWGSGIEAMSRGFVTYTLKRHLKYLEDELNSKLFPKNTGRFVKFDLSELIEGDSKAQAEYNRSALGGPGAGMGWMTVDEIRASRGLAPLGGKAAELFDPNAMAEAQMASAEATEPAPDKTAEQVANMVEQLTAKVQMLGDRQAAPAPVINMAPASISLSTKEIDEGINRAIDAISNAHADKIRAIEDAMQVTINVEKQDAPVVNVAAPIINFTPNVEAPIVNVTNEVQPAEVNVNLPSRKTETVIMRDAQGNITRATQLEQDA
jgi:HK97 family phage portal protein